MHPRLPPFRSSLLRMHRALLLVEEQLYAIDETPILTTFEKMVLLLEDRRFFEHSGYDWKAIVREVLKALAGRRFGGASTIDMQLFRTASDRYERTLRRKLREIVGVIALQRRFTKIQILRTYLTIAYFGTGLKGAVQAAATLYPDEFDDLDVLEDLKRLDVNRAARLATLLVYPKPRVPHTDWLAKITRRADYALALYAGRDQQLEKIQRR
jgi:membrane peptidoglycan carboxypeptidase